MSEVYRRAVYRLTASGMEEKTAESLEEMWALCAAGWSLHPEEARQLAPVGSAIVSMNKTTLEAYARSFGIELDRRKSLDNMRKDLERSINE